MLDDHLHEFSIPQSACMGHAAHIIVISIIVLVYKASDVNGDSIIGNNLWRSRSLDRKSRCQNPRCLVTASGSRIGTSFSFPRKLVSN